MNYDCTNAESNAAAVVGAMLGLGLAAAIGATGQERVDGMRRMASREFRRRCVPRVPLFSWSSIQAPGSQFKDRYGRAYAVSPSGQVWRAETLRRRIEERQQAQMRADARDNRMAELAEARAR